MSLRRLMLAALLLVPLCAAREATAALIVNPAQPITHEVRVQVIHLYDDAGNNPAPLLGTPAQQAAIEAFLDQIWAQAGIDIVLEATVNDWDSTFGLQGSVSPRPTSDLGTMVTMASGAGVLSADPFTLNMFFVDVVPGSSQNGNNTVNGLAFLGGNGSAMWVGPNLPGFVAGQEVVASVIAHEIGHNLGLPHIVEAFNLMQASASPSQGEQLNAGQIATALASPFSHLIPEPPAVLLLLLAAARLAWQRSSARRA